MPELTQVPRPLHMAQDQQSNYFKSDIPTFSLEGNSIHVRPTTIASVTVTYTNPPAEITNFTLEVTAVDEQWHWVIADLATAYAYAQEEDVQQASYYRQRAFQQIQIRMQELPATKEID